MRMALVLVSLLSVPVRPALAAMPERPKFELRSSDGQSSLRLQLAAQLRLELKHLDPAGTDDPLVYGFVFRRIRPVLSGSPFTDKLTYQLHLNLVPGAIELMDLYVDYAFAPGARVRGGQFKIPFTRHRINSFQDRLLVEWSLPTRFFGAERQQGVMLHNNQGSPLAVEYQLGLFGGDNVRAANGIGMAMAYGERPPNASDLDDPEPLAEPHGEVVGHVAYNAGGINVRRPSDLEGGPLRWSAGLSAAVDLAPVARLDHRLRLAPEASLKVNGYSLVAVGYLGLFDEVAGDGRFAPGLVGGLVEGGYFFAERYEVSLRYATIRYLEGLRDDARTDADQRIAALSGDEAAELTAELRSVGAILGEHEANVGFNVYLYGTTVKWQTDLGLLLHQRRTENRYDLVARTQLALAF